tara:strand:+ start:335 stop:1015 length:681 start_codon:yes stop_codon:yes gene_type:complete
VLIFIIFLNVNSCAQQSIGVNYSIDRTYRSLIANERGNNSQSIVDYSDSIYFPSIKNTVGISIQKFINENIILDFGILYIKTGYQSIKIKNLRVPDENQIYVDNMTNFINLKYLSLPIKLKWIISKNKIQTFLVSGLSANIFLKSNSSFLHEYNDGTTQTTFYTYNSDKFLSISIVLGLGIDIPINRNYSIEINPIFRRSLTKFHDFSYNEYLYSYGINLGINYKF